jgi:hypothetical protein
MRDISFSFGPNLLLFTVFKKIVELRRRAIDSVSSLDLRGDSFGQNLGNTTTSQGGGNVDDPSSGGVAAPNCEIEGGREGDPNQIGNKKPSRRSRLSLKENESDDDRDPQHQDLNRRPEQQMGRKERPRPYPVQKKLYAEDRTG